MPPPLLANGPGYTIWAFTVQWNLSIRTLGSLRFSEYRVLNFYKTLNFKSDVELKKWCSENFHSITFILPLILLVNRWFFYKSLPWKKKVLDDYCTCSNSFVGFIFLIKPLKQRFLACNKLLSDKVVPKVISVISI